MRVAWRRASQFKRALDTGTLLGFGEVKPTADVTERGLVVSPNENKRREQALRALATKVPPPGINVVIVSHKPNIMDAFGKGWFDLWEGEASVQAGRQRRRRRRAVKNQQARRKVPQLFPL